MRIPFFDQKPEQVPKEKLTFGPLTPPHDPVMVERLQSVYDGKLPLFHAEVPVAKIKLRYINFRPELAPDGAKVLERFVRDLRTACDEDRLDQWPRPFLYVEGEDYISADDYFLILAYRQLGLTRVPCFVLGEPTVEGTSKIVGPADLEAAKRLVTGEK